MFTAQLPLPAEGHAAYFAEVEFTGAAPFKLTTPMRVIAGGSAGVVPHP